MSQEDIEYLKRRRSSPGFRRACYRLAGELGVEIDLGLGDMCAPKGYRFKWTGSHTVVFYNDEDDYYDWEKAYETLKWGLEPCPDPECDYCYYE